MGSNVKIEKTNPKKQMPASIALSGLVVASSVESESIEDRGSNWSFFLLGSSWLGMLFT